MDRAAVVLTLAAVAGGCGDRGPVAESVWVFGSEAHIELRDVGAAQGAAALAETTALLQRLDQEWHAWRPSDLTRINAALAAGEPAPAPASILDALGRARPLVDASGGLFDPAIGGLVRLWGFHRSEFPILEPAPDEAAIAAWRTRRPRLSDLRIEGERVASDNPALQIDLAAIAEGVAAERIAAILTRHGIDHALVSIGGDLLALGRAGPRPWRVGLRDPFGTAPDSTMAAIALSGREALFTSGGYQRYRVDPAGGRWPHILDPRSGRPAMESATAVVLHPDPVTADAAATALFVAGPEGFSRLTDAMRLGCALLLDRDDRLWITSALAARLQWRRMPARRTVVDRGEACQIRG